jgi:hypothetical protein
MLLIVMEKQLRQERSTCQQVETQLQHELATLEDAWAALQRERSAREEAQGQLQQEHTALGEVRATLQLRESEITWLTGELVPETASFEEKDASTRSCSRRTRLRARTSRRISRLRVSCPLRLFDCRLDSPRSALDLFAFRSQAYRLLFGRQ